MPAKDTPQENTDDMSIDELSAAIDAHMTEIDKPKPKKKPAPKVEVKTEPTPAAKKKEEPKEEPKEEEGQTKIKVKHAYVSKKDEKSSAALPEKEKSQITHTSNVKLKPISKTENEEPKPAAKSKPNTDTVDVVVKTPPKAQEPKEEPKKEVEKTPETPEPAPEPESKAEEVAEEDQPDDKEETEDAPVETVEKPVVKAEPAKFVTPVQRGNSTDELSAQIPSAKPPEEDTEVPEGEKLKTFDTKQYHIPIKASHHHRRGGSFKVFIAVMAVILATIYVMSELEIIDLASLVAN